MFDNKMLLALGASVCVVLGTVFYFNAPKKHHHAEENIVLMNVLDKEYFDDCHIPGSVNVPVDKVDEYIKTLSKDDTIVVYCTNYACTASGSVAEELVNHGIKKVYAYEAGITGWFSAGYKCDGECKQPYLTMPNTPLEHADAKHAYAIIETAELKKLIDNCAAQKQNCHCCAGH